MNHDQKLKSSRKSAEIICWVGRYAGLQWWVGIRLSNYTRKTLDSPVTDITAGSQQIKPAWARTALPFFASLLWSWGVMFPWSSGGNCARLLHSIWPPFYFSAAPPKKTHSFSLCLVSLSPVQRVMTPAPDCGRLKSLEVVSGSHLKLSLLWMLGGVERKKGIRGGVAGACGDGWGWSIMGITLSSKLTESITNYQTPKNTHRHQYPSAPPVHLHQLHIHAHTYPNHPSCHWYHQQKSPKKSTNVCISGVCNHRAFGDPNGLVH